MAYSTSSFTIDGSVSIESTNGQPSGITFSTSGLKMFVGRDNDAANRGIVEYDLVCPFNIIAGKCPPITENKDRTGIAIAQMEIAKRTIDHSTDTALNRLKWIRRNKDKQNLTNLNINFNFTNQRLASLTENESSLISFSFSSFTEERFYLFDGGLKAISEFPFGLGFSDHYLKIGEITGIFLDSHNYFINIIYNFLFIWKSDVNSRIITLFNLFNYFW